MSFRLKKLLEILNKEYKFDMQEKWDNSGFQIGNLQDEVFKILLTMDVSFESVLYAVKNNFNCIISHHPLFFEKITSLDFNSKFYKKIKLIMDNNINVISIHTPLDFHENGVNKALAKACMLKSYEHFIDYTNDFGYGLVGNVDNQNVIDYIKKIKFKNNFENIIFYGNRDINISKIAVLGGSGAFSIKKAIDLDVDLLISSDFKYHDIQYAIENSLSLVDLGHYESEFFGLYELEIFLKNNISSSVDIYIYKNNVFKKYVL